MTTFNLGGEGGNSFSFGKQGTPPGAFVRGKVLNLEEVQETNYDTGKPEFWDDGRPKMQFKVTLQTELRDPENPADDGVRAVFLKGRRKPHPENGTHSTICAVLEAVKEATGRTELQYGAELTLQWVSGMGFSGDPRHYQAWYTPPAMELQQPPEHATPAAPPAAAAAPAFGSPADQGHQPPPAWAQAPVVSTATGQPVVHQQQIPVPPPPAAAAPPAQPELPVAPSAAPPAAAPPAAAAAPAWGGGGVAVAPPPAAPPAVAPAAPPAAPAALDTNPTTKPLTQVEVQALQNAGMDPAQVYGADWQSRITS